MAMTVTRIENTSEEKGGLLQWEDGIAIYQKTRGCCSQIPTRKQKGI